jgi:hypothetical protein
LPCRKCRPRVNLRLQLQNVEGATVSRWQARKTLGNLERILGHVILSDDDLFPRHDRHRKANLGGMELVTALFAQAAGASHRAAYLEDCN